MKSKISAALLFCQGLAFSQCDLSVLGPNNVGGYTYPVLREANVVWTKRVWRIIDLREKMNLPLYYPLEPIGNQKNLATLLRDEVLNGSLIAYNPLKDDFSDSLTIEQVRALFVQTDTVWEENSSGGTTAKPIVTAVDLSKVKRLRIKEDWFFDQQRSVMDARIIGICPVIESYDDEGNYRGDQLLFWVYFPKCRCAFENNLAFNTNKDAEKLNYFQVFTQRTFASYIYMESNVRGAKVSDYKTGKDALIESEIIKNKIRKTEEDMWEY
ncbi:MAG: gliding motility protein GldN [Bacteroidetes bacterium]|nr:gliding motility protein GldN [Bacteroidota bacterium]